MYICLSYFLLVALSIKAIKRERVSFEDFEACKCVGVSIKISKNSGSVALASIVKLCVYFNLCKFAN